MSPMETVIPSQMDELCQYDNSMEKEQILNQINLLFISFVTHRS